MSTATITRQDVIHMEAGEHLDDLVHVRVMGGCLHKQGFESVDEYDPEGPVLKCKTCEKRTILSPGVNAVLIWPNPEYSTDIARAWLVVEAMRKKGVCFSIEVECAEGHASEPLARFFTGGHGKRALDREHAGFGPAPLAICRAALLASLDLR